MRAKLLLVCTLAAACGGPTTPHRRVLAPPPTAVAEITLLEAGLDPAALDRRADPCQDFYQFACGGWLTHTEIPADQSRYGRFAEIKERNQAELRSILDEAWAAAVHTRGPASGPTSEPASAPASGPTIDAATRTLGDFYGACMDEPGLEARGLHGLDALRETLAKVEDAHTLAAAVAAFHQHGIWVLFSVSSEQDFDDATQVIAFLDQAGLGLPDREQYLSDDPKARTLRERYILHVQHMFALAGHTPDESKAAAEDVLRIETELAKVSKTRVERRDVQGLRNKLDAAALKQLAPNFEWEDYFPALGVNPEPELNLTSLPFFTGLDHLLQLTSPQSWRRYLEWHLLNATAMNLPRAFVDEHFTLVQALTGQQALEERWKRCVVATDAALGDLLAEAFVKRRFGGDSKQAAETMIKAVGESFLANLDALPWMDDDTRERAREKEAAMAWLIGYPAQWRAYRFDVDPADLAGNVLRGAHWRVQDDLDDIGQPVDRDEWLMTPPTVNAYYNPQLNHMVFPAGILQKPFYDHGATLPVNLGAMGMIVGHELTHGFDDQGAQFDPQGNLRDWWNEDVSASFKQQNRCFIDQYARYEVLPGLKLNGELTLGENIADNAGVKLAWDAWQSMRGQEKVQHLAEGFSEEQQFFLATGQAWCSKDREELSRLLVTVDPHSPPRFRVNGTLANLPAFAEAFKCAPDTAMNPTDRCSVW